MLPQVDLKGFQFQSCVHQSFQSKDRKLKSKTWSTHSGTVVSMHCWAVLLWFWGLCYYNLVPLCRSWGGEWGMEGESHIFFCVCKAEYSVFTVWFCSELSDTLTHLGEVPGFHSVNTFCFRDAAKGLCSDICALTSLNSLAVRWVQCDLGLST